jgi:hypothetical protein
MTVVAWFCFIFFGFWSLMFIGALFDPKIKSVNIPLFFFVFILCALSAGVIWGHLFQ